MAPRDDSIAATTEVLVVGAGPTGLLLAVELERRGVSCLLIDELDAPRGWDRATVVHPRSMEIFEALGLVDQLLESGVKTRGARLRSDGEIIGVLDIELVDSRYGFDLGISEEVTESVLTSHLERLGGGVTRSTRLAGYEAGPDGVAATLERDGETQQVAASWIVGCDGLHSVVREVAGIDFPGTDLEAPWAVFDATIDGWDEEFDMAASYLDIPPVILTPLPDLRWRVYVRPTSEDSDVVADATGVLHQYKPHANFADIENPTRFRCHSRVAERFRSGRVVLAGDAAHACSPAEGHGMNTGMQDAFNLGWKLALVCAGKAGPRLLDSYEAERRPVALRVMESGAGAEAIQLLTRDEERAARDSDMRQTFSDPDSAHHEAVAAAELDRSYADSRVVSGDAIEGLPAGSRLPDTASVLPVGKDSAALHELTHRPGHTLLVLGGREAGAAEVAEVAGALERAHAGSPIIDYVVGLCSEPGDLPVGHLGDAVAQQLGITGVTLLAVRPDRYIGFRHEGADAGSVNTYLAALTA